MPFQDPVEMGLTLPQLEQIVRDQAFLKTLTDYDITEDEKFSSPFDE